MNLPRSADFSPQDRRPSAPLRTEVRAPGRTSAFTAPMRAAFGVRTFPEPRFARARLLPSHRTSHHDPARQEPRPTGSMVTGDGASPKVSLTTAVFPLRTVPEVPSRLCKSALPDQRRAFLTRARRVAGLGRKHRQRGGSRVPWDITLEEGYTRSHQNCHCKIKPRQIKPRPTGTISLPSRSHWGAAWRSSVVVAHGAYPPKAGPRVGPGIGSGGAAPPPARSKRTDPFLCPHSLAPLGRPSPQPTSRTPGARRMGGSRQRDGGKGMGAKE